MSRKSTSDRTRRDILHIVGVSGITGIAGCSGFVGSSSDEPSPTTIEQTTTTRRNESTTAEKGLPKLVEPNGVIAEAPVPSESESIMYATMGTGETPVTATLYGAWFCPHTNNFVTDFMDEIIRQYVKPGKVTLRFRAVAYENGEGFHGSNEPKVARAALAVWNEAPEKYWSFFHYLFKNISATETWSVNNVVKLAKAAGVEVTEPVRKAYNGNSTYQDEIAATMDQVQKIPISAVPRIVVGETVSKPSVSHQETIDQLEKALPGST